jgi:hypothetical protein
MIGDEKKKVPYDYLSIRSRAAAGEGVRYVEVRRSEGE